MFKGKAGGAQMKPLQGLQREELDSWGGYDSGNKKSRMTQYANAYQGQNDEQNNAMFGQGGDVNKMMGTIWDGIKTGAGNTGKFISKWDSNIRKQQNPEANTGNPYPNPNQPTTEEIPPGVEGGTEQDFSNADGSSTKEVYNEETGTWGPMPSGEPAVGTTKGGKYGYGNTADGQDIIYPAGKNIIGGNTDPITKGAVNDMGMNFMMGGVGGGGNALKAGKKSILGLYNKYKGGFNG